MTCLLRPGERYGMETKVPVGLALYQPDIPQNTGTILRLAACMSVPVHIIHPTGFAFTDARLKRAGMDYAARAERYEHDSFSAFQQYVRDKGRRVALLTTKAQTSLYDTAFAENDILLLGRESAGVPDAVAASADLRLRLPMHPDFRSLNVALAASMALGEALRQTGGLPAH